MEATLRRELIAASLAILLGCNPVFAQVAGIGSPMPGMGVTSPFGMGSAAGSVGPAGVPLGATELATPGLSPAPPSTLGSGFTICSAVVGAPTTNATGTFDGGGVGTSMDTSQMGMAGTSSTSGSCNQASGAGTAGTLPTTLSSPWPLSGPTLPTNGSISAQGSC